MSWLKKKEPKVAKIKELEKTKQARKKVVGQAITASRNAAKVIESNGFTVKIYLAAGGKTTKKGNSHAH